MTYLIDSDVFIQAKNLHYGFDFCPAFWDWLDQANAVGLVASIEKVLDELKAGDDELTAWASARAPFFLRPDTPVIASLQATSAWAAGAGFQSAAVSTFLQAADQYLVAHAHAHGLVVVSHETASDAKKKIKIPNACIAMGVKCMTPFQMLRAERARFTLGTAPAAPRLFE